MHYAEGYSTVDVTAVPYHGWLTLTVTYTVALYSVCPLIYILALVLIHLNVGVLTWQGWG